MVVYGFAVLLAAALAFALSANAVARARVRTALADPAACPLQPTSATPSGEAWAFTETSPPATPHPGIVSSYSHGRGSWGAGRGAGTICTEDGVAGLPAHNLVLAVTGAAHISPQITRLGHLGTGLALNVKVAASDDHTCAAGTNGTVALFASYYQGHHDSFELRLSGGCGSYRYTYTGTQVHVLIADNGRQVN